MNQLSPSTAWKSVPIQRKKGNPVLIFSWNNCLRIIKSFYFTLLNSILRDRNGSTLSQTVHIEASKLDESENETFDCWNSTNSNLWTRRRRIGRCRAILRLFRRRENPSMVHLDKWSLWMLDASLRPTWFQYVFRLKGKLKSRREFNDECGGGTRQDTVRCWLLVNQETINKTVASS